MTENKYYIELDTIHLYYIIALQNKLNLERGKDLKKAKNILLNSTKQN
jgi:hypothetical protein